MALEHLRFLIPGWRDVIGILIVAFVIYQLLLFLAGTRALQILVGLFVLGLVYFAALVFKFTMIATLLGVVFTYGAFAAVVVFQPELRYALARLGRSRVLRLFTASTATAVAEEVSEAVERLARTGTGAIIAVEQDVSLDDYLETGTPMRATVSADLLTPLSAYLRIAQGSARSFLLESVEGGERLGRYSFLGSNPSLVLRAAGGRAGRDFRSGHQDGVPGRRRQESWRGNHGIWPNSIPSSRSSSACSAVVSP